MTDFQVVVPHHSFDHFENIPQEIVAKCEQIEQLRTQIQALNRKIWQNVAEIKEADQKQRAVQQDGCLNW